MNTKITFLSNSKNKVNKMFLVKDKSENREKRILDFVNKDPPISVILAVALFEWTIRRAIISLNNKLNKITRSELKEIYSLKKYKDYWANNISERKSAKRLPEIIADWGKVIEAFNLRNRLVHGCRLEAMPVYCIRI